ncbi:unnamed protein product [Sphenostylis stenocarpa]|uniref:Uncharacterized protein n=1 Tax=Sphenostylis stenocarpa TaxID=92480 RepID=A0AA86TJ27_9FABA|nr:unnamed protein product [Sphenostylis stenocarpa]
MSSIKPPWSLVIPDELSYESFNRNSDSLARFAYPTLEFKGPEETRPCLGKASLMLEGFTALLTSSPDLLSARLDRDPEVEIEAKVAAEDWTGTREGQKQDLLGIADRGKQATLSKLNGKRAYLIAALSGKLPSGLTGVFIAAGLDRFTRMVGATGAPTIPRS